MHKKESGLNLSSEEKQQRAGSATRGPEIYLEMEPLDLCVASTRGQRSNPNMEIKSCLP